MASIRRRNDRWQVQVRRKGSPPTTRTFTLRADALAWARQAELAIDRNGLPTSRRQLKALTLGNLLTRYLAEVTPRKKSKEKEAYRIKRLLNSDLAGLSLAHLRPHHIARFRDKRLQEVGTQAVRHDLNLINNMFSVAGREWDLNLPANPLVNLALPPISKPRERRLSEEELGGLLQAARRIAPDYLPDLIVCLIETAMRKGEAFRINRDDYDLRNGTTIIREAKNGHARRFPLSPKAIEVLTRRTSKGIQRPFNVAESLLRSHWHRATKAAGIKNLHIHDLRHEGISRLFERGLTVPEVATVSGHRDIRQLARYGHANLASIATKLGI